MRDNGRVRQFELQDDSARLVCWLPDDPRLKRGTRLTLKETGDRIWMVTTCYVSLVDKASLRKPWRVGGLISAGDHP